MGKFFSLTSIALIIGTNPSVGAGEGMPQLNTELWSAQIFWLILIFSILYLTIWKFILPKITNSIENRRKHVINDLDEAQKLKESSEKKLEEYKKDPKSHLPQECKENENNRIKFHYNIQ